MSKVFSWTELGSGPLNQGPLPKVRAPRPHPVVKKYKLNWKSPPKGRQAVRSHPPYIKGITWDWYNMRWVARGCPAPHQMKKLYQGKDYFEACCRVRAWELKQYGPLGSKL